MSKDYIKQNYNDEQKSLISNQKQIQEDSRYLSFIEKRTHSQDSNIPKSSTDMININSSL